MKTKFEFLGEHYTDEKTLALALARNFADAINYIFTENFLNSVSDSYLKGRIVAEIRRCKYVESAVSMVIYLLNPELGLCVKGKFFKSLKDLANYMCYETDSDDKAIIHLFLDHAITHTLALVESDSQDFRKDIVYVEEHIEDKSIYDYFISLFDVGFKQNDAHGLSVFDYALYGIASEKDKFQAFLELLDTPSFKSCLYSHFGISYTLSLYEKSDYPYVIFNLLKDNTSIDLTPFTGNGVHVWTLTKIKNYKFTRIAKKIKHQMKKLAGKAKKVQLFNEKLNNSSQCYELYKCFVDAYDYGFIVAKEEQYELNYDGYKNRASLAYINELKLPLDKYEVVFPKSYDKKDKRLIVKHLKKRLKLIGSLEVEVPQLTTDELTKEQIQAKKEAKKLENALNDLERTRNKINQKRDSLHKKYNVSPSE